MKDHNEVIKKEDLVNLTNEFLVVTKQQEIRTIAERIDRIMNDAKGIPLPSMFWEDLDALLNLILKDKKENE